MVPSCRTMHICFLMGAVRTLRAYCIVSDEAQGISREWLMAELAACKRLTFRRSHP
jgi:hypothetical protein